MTVLPEYINAAMARLIQSSVTSKCSFHPAFFSGTETTKHILNSQLKIVNNQQLSVILPLWYFADMATLGVEKFKASAIRDTVAEALRRSLLEGRFQPGENLSDVAIASEFEISRGPVREAMLVLAGEGLLTHTQNRGFSVLNFTEDDLSKIDVVRLPLESLALARARERAAPSDIDRLKAVKANLCRLFETGDKSGRLHAEFEFHSMIWELSGNSWLVASLKRIMVPGFTYGTALRMNRPDLSAQVLDRLHNLYIEYLEGTSSYSAEECVRLHIGLPVTPV